MHLLKYGSNTMVIFAILPLSRILFVIYAECIYSERPQNEVGKIKVKFRRIQGAEIEGQKHEQRQSNQRNP